MSQKMNSKDRDALVVGINNYRNLRKLKKPSQDAQAIGELLDQHGEFLVKALPPAAGEADSKWFVKLSTTGEVTTKELKDALIKLFKPEGKHIPDTALFFYSGHGLRENQGIKEGYLATSEVNPKDGNLGLSLGWLRRLLRESPIRQQIVLLDCCYSGEFLMFNEQIFKQADPGERGNGLDRCFITASREYEEAWEEVHGEHGVLTSLLLEGLDPSLRGAVDNYSLADFIKQKLKVSKKIQRPLFSNSGRKILLTGRTAASVHSTQENVCPYKGLQYFDYEGDDPKYFFGRETLTDELIDKVKNGNFIAVLGASGSGKSSLVRAGLLYQLQQGEKLAGSELWPKPVILRPGTQPIHNLAVATGIPLADLQANPDALANWIPTILNAPNFRQKSDVLRPRQVILVDQFEELFTLCLDVDQRQAFLASLLGALDSFSQSADNTDNLCFVLTMRSDFLGRCAEHDYLGLAKRIQQNFVTATPMQEEDLRSAILRPAEEVGLEVEGDLVDEMIADVSEAPGSLPLLQYTLKVLWEKRKINRLTLSSYRDSGGIEGTLAGRAESVYEKFSREEQEIAQNLLLMMVSPGEGTEHSRVQVERENVINDKQTENVADCLIKAGLLVSSKNKGGSAVLDVVHEALIRNWGRLCEWVEQYRSALSIQRDIEKYAKEWKQSARQVGYLLKDARLSKAESYLKESAEQLPLSQTASDFINASLEKRDELLLIEEKRKTEKLEQAQARKKQLWVAIIVLVTLLLTIIFLLNNIREEAEHNELTIKLMSSSPDNANDLWEKMEGDRLNNLVRGTIDNNRLLDGNHRQYWHENYATLEKSEQRDLFAALKKIDRMHSLFRDYAKTLSNNENYSKYFESLITGNSLNQDPLKRLMEIMRQTGEMEEIIGANEAGKSAELKIKFFNNLFYKLIDESLLTSAEKMEFTEAVKDSNERESSNFIGELFDPLTNSICRDKILANSKSNVHKLPFSGDSSAYDDTLSKLNKKALSDINAIKSALARQGCKPFVGDISIEEVLRTPSVIEVLTQ